MIDLDDIRRFLANWYQPPDEGRSLSDFPPPDPGVWGAVVPSTRYWTAGHYDGCYSFPTKEPNV